MPSAAPPATTSEIQPRAATSARASAYWLPLVLAWLFSAIWMWKFLLRQWVPHDEGAFADMASRILRGEVPHRDFLDLYTGGLAYLHAFAWKIFGSDLAAFRYVLYAFALGWVPALYYIATRFVRPIVAAGVVVIAVAWSLPNYPAAVPSWYNLFFATWGTAALLRFDETSSRRWLFVAGLCGGLSFLAKVSGLFFVFAAALYLVHRNQSAKGSEHNRTAMLLRCLTIAVVTLAVVRIISGWLTARTLLYFIAPTLVLAGVLLKRELKCLRERTGGQTATFISELLTLAAGVLAPVLCFLLIYMHGGFGDFVRGVFILPARRLQFAQADPPPLYAIAIATAVWLLCGIIIASRRTSLRIAGSTLLAALFVVAFWQDFALQSIWQSLSASVPIAVVAAAILVRKSDRLFLLAVVAALCSLVQFPFGVPVYFCYVVPLLILLIAAVFASRFRVSRSGVAVVLAFYAISGLALMNTGSIYSLGEYYDRPQINAHLNAPGAGKLRVLPNQAALYNAIVPVVLQHARGEYVFAGPSAPEIYFLTGHRNPARWTFDFFDDRSRDPEFIAQMLQSHDVNVVVVNVKPDFDPAPPPDMLAMYARLYPHAQTFGHFEVRWRE